MAHFDCKIWGISPGGSLLSPIGIGLTSNLVVKSVISSSSFLYKKILNLARQDLQNFLLNHKGD